MSPAPPAPFVGIDVSKDHLDVWVRPAGLAFRLANDPGGIADLVRRLTDLAPQLLVLEATGGYEAPAAAACAAAGLPVAVVNPRQAHDFAKATGRLAKTDALDAAGLAHFAEAVHPAPRPLPDDQARALRELLSRRQQLLQLRTAERNRLPTTATRPVRRDIERHLAWLERRLKALEQELQAAIVASPVWRVQDQLLQSVPGIGPQVARTLLAELPELGQLDSRKLASLAGLAPRNHDSGRKRGYRRIGGGRKAVRCALYQASVVAVRHNRTLRAFYERLKGAGKKSKVALIAVARKLLTIVNAMLRDRVPWAEKVPLPT